MVVSLPNGRIPQVQMAQMGWGTWQKKKKNIIKVSTITFQLSCGPDLKWHMNLLMCRVNIKLEVFISPICHGVSFNIVLFTIQC